MHPEAQLDAHHFEALGTTCAVFAVGASRDRLLDAESWVRALGARLTRFSTTSELSLLNASSGRWTATSAEMDAILRASLDAFEMSGGLVNIAVLPAVLAAGYTRTLSEGPTVSVLESPPPIPALPDVLEVRRGGARLRPGASLDLGGIAKGWMADRLGASIGPNNLANIGGDLMATGGGPRGEGWPVGLGGVTLMLRDQGAATSSVRRRRWGDLHHLIDPRTGAPTRSGLDEVSAVAAGGLEAEVVAKTALLLGPELAPAYCAAHALAWWLGGES
ncbi:MAG TPA: FAD:protein FMN transferase [Candidatus Dormibacteraeota bacterium]|jgi:thiamine biosynthesis lipoprotein|nr:FAD:protein FMN transferase [Candidatus Dormibacteraeota bacterium]